jgi:hypothetical protein
MNDYVAPLVYAFSMSFNEVAYPFLVEILSFLDIS